jgi:hypothetical protein
MNIGHFFGSIESYKNLNIVLNLLDESLTRFWIEENFG